MVWWVSTWTIYWVKEKLSSLISHTWESSFKLFQDTNDIFLLKSFTLPLIQIRVLWSKLMTQCKPPQAVFPSSKASLFISMQWEDASIRWMCLSQPIKLTCKFFNSWGENYISVSPNVHVCLVGALSTPKGTIFSPCQACICMHTSGWEVKPFGSDALYHAKLDWITIWTCLERTVLMKGIFSTFGSVKSSLSNRKETKCWVMLFIPFQSTGFTRQWRQTSCRNQTKTVYRMITKSSFVYKDSGPFMSDF